jgi:hypothetical protein
MANHVEDYDCLVGFLRRLPAAARVALEPTSDFHRTLAHRPLREGFSVVSVSSAAGARDREGLGGNLSRNPTNHSTRLDSTADSDRAGCRRAVCARRGVSLTEEAVRPRGPVCGRAEGEQAGNIGGALRVGAGSRDSVRPRRTGRLSGLRRRRKSPRPARGQLSSTA